MLQSPLHHWTGEYRRRQCVRSIYPAIQLLVEKAHLAGWSREEALVAIADAADNELTEITDPEKDTIEESAVPLAAFSGQPPRPPFSLQSRKSFVSG